MRCWASAASLARTRSGRATTFAEQIQDAIDSGADLDWIRRRFHLSESELRDYCTDIIEADEAWDAAHAGFGESGY